MKKERMIEVIKQAVEDRRYLFKQYVEQFGEDSQQANLQYYMLLEAERIARNCEVEC